MPAIGGGYWGGITHLKIPIPYMYRNKVDFQKRKPQQHEASAIVGRVGGGSGALT